MAIYAISEATMTALADAIRVKTKDQKKMTPEEMVAAINGIVSHTEDFDALIMRTSETVRSETATYVADYAMFSNQAVRNIELPAAQSVGEYAFCSCGNLESVLTNATSIGAHAFYGCDKLTSVTWGAGLTEIGVGAFDGCASLKVVNLRDATFAALSASAFANSGLTELWLPEGRFCNIPNDGVFAGAPVGAGGSGGVIYVPSKYRVRYEADNRWAPIFRGGQNRIVSY